jgi:FtsZ-binding cell division protein ZapB
MANVHPFMLESDASAEIMQREIALLRIEIEQLRGKEDEARKMKEFLPAYVERVEHLCADRAHWQREAERLNALIAKVPRWSLFWARCCVGASKTWRKLRRSHYPEHAGPTTTNTAICGPFLMSPPRSSDKLAEVGGRTPPPPPQ